MLIDTSASSVVLPTSLAPLLGFRPEQLRRGVAETAGGDVAAGFAVPNTVEVGHVIRRNIAVAFVADRKPWWCSVAWHEFCGAVSGDVRQSWVTSTAGRKLATFIRRVEL
ncbi:MAG: clan AA aspartic protease [Chromatiales bacterium]|jgi:hypothetical protein|nr:clan AA aspartic protease [Chromatiales bacterium]